MVSLLALAACAERFEVLVVNQGNVPVKIGIGQFHAPDFTANPPASFTEKELIGQQIVELQPNEQRKLVYNSAAGGFWLQWRMLDPLPEPNPLVRLDLIRDERRIVIR
ncbi:hypothetical protein ASC91_00015 [Pelomonas sp. Root1237]|nr:hypothetical protein ASC91_00015 [Pelomonas sp. Root1237]